MGTAKDFGNCEDGVHLAVSSFHSTSSLPVNKSHLPYPDLMRFASQEALRLKSCTILVKLRLCNIYRRNLSPGIHEIIVLNY